MSPFDFWRTLELIGAQFPQYLPLLSEQGIFDIFSQAIQDPAAWSPERIQSAIQQTPWYKNTPAAARTWYLLDITDPSTATQKKADAKILVDRISGSLGIPMSPYDSAILALNAAVNGWDEGRIRIEIVAKTSGATTIGPGSIGDQMTQFEGLAAQYGVPINHNDLYWWAANTQGGTVTQEGYRDYLTQQAINLYPALTPALQQGQTVAQYAAPYFQMAANELGINPSQITLLNPKWLEVFLGQDDKGSQRVLNLNESMAKIRSDPALGYDHGLPARTQAATFASQLLQKFGAGSV